MSGYFVVTLFVADWALTAAIHSFIWRSLPLMTALTQPPNFFVFSHCISEIIGIFAAHFERDQPNGIKRTDEQTSKEMDEACAAVGGGTARGTDYCAGDY